MNKQEFLLQLRKNLFGLPQKDIEERLSFYEEMIDDRMEEGCSEEEAILAIGPTEKIAAQIISETPLAKIAKKKAGPMGNHSFGAWLPDLAFLGNCRGGGYPFSLHFPMGRHYFSLGGFWLADRRLYRELGGGIDLSSSWQSAHRLPDAFGGIDLHWAFNLCFLWLQRSL